MGNAVIKNKNLDMTKGSPWRLLMAFALPLLAGNVLQQFYNMVDSIVVGKYVGPQALAAVGTSNPIINLLVSLFMGVGAGASILISQFFGAREYARMRKASFSVWQDMRALALSPFRHIPLSSIPSNTFGLGLAILPYVKQIVPRWMARSCQIFHSIWMLSLVACMSEINPSATSRLSSKPM